MFYWACGPTESCYPAPDSKSRHPHSRTTTFDEPVSQHKTKAALLHLACFLGCFTVERWWTSLVSPFPFLIFFWTFLASYYLPATIARVHGKAVIWNLTGINRHSVSIVSCSVKWLKLQFCPLGSSLLCCISSVICIRLYSKLKQNEKVKLQSPSLLGFELRTSPPNHHSMLDYTTTEQISSQILPKDHPVLLGRQKKTVYKHRNPITDHR